MIEVSIIIVNFNTKELLDKCIESIYSECNGNNYEIIVVDNNSDDDSIKMIIEKYPEVITVKNDKNYGFGKANNIGVRHSNGKYLLLLNSDTIVKNNIVDNFLSFYKKNSLNSNIGCLGAWLYNIDNNITNSIGHFPSKRGVINDYINIIFKRNTIINPENLYRDEKYTEVEYITGALLFFEKSIFLKFNGFDEEFFMYYEETDLQYRMSIDSFKRIIINGPKVIHLEGQSPNISNRKRIIYTQSMYVFFKKRTSRLKFSIFKIITLFLRLPTFFKRDYTFKENIEFFRYMFNA